MPCCVIHSSCGLRSPRACPASLWQHVACACADCAVSMSNLLTLIQVVMTKSLCLFPCPAGVIPQFLCSGVQQAPSPCWECAGVSSKHVVPLGNSAAATLTKQGGSGGLVGRVNRACSVGLMVCVRCAPAQLRKASAQPHWRPCPCQALVTRARSTICVRFNVQIHFCPVAGPMRTKPACWCRIGMFGLYFLLIRGGRTAAGRSVCFLFIISAPASLAFAQSIIMHLDAGSVCGWVTHW
jgi:hypothetical protein